MNSTTDAPSRSQLRRGTHRTPADNRHRGGLSGRRARRQVWIFACLRLSEKPRFVRATPVLIPAFILPHLYTGIIYEVRQMDPLGFVVTPAAFFWMSRESN